MIPEVFDIEGERYIAVKPFKDLKIEHESPPCFITVISVDEVNGSVAEDVVRSIITNYKEDDDVFRKEFLKGVIFTSSSEVQLSPEAREYLKSGGTEWVETHIAASKQTLPPPGPYYVHEQRLYEIWRLYEDSQGAFLIGLLPETSDKFTTLQLTGPNIQTISVAVPSRLPHLTNRTTNPLSGLRIVLKDLFQITGIRTSIGNKSYYHTYPAAISSTPCIDLLRQKGAYIISTTKLSALVGVEEPIECIDYQAPWNPRGDGHQSPAGSSSGSGVAVAAYDWVDVGVGSDTNGSGRRPALWNGCFSLRPTWRFDVPVLFTRDLFKGKEFAKAWYDEQLPHHLLVQERSGKLPHRIVYPTDQMSLINDTQKEIVDSFVADLEKSFGIKREEISLTHLWETHPPAEAKGQSLNEYMEDLDIIPPYDDFHLFSQFRKDHKEKFGKPPYISVTKRFKWQIGAKITKKGRDTAMEHVEVYAKWLREQVLNAESYDTVIIIPIEDVSPRYRDEPLKHSCRTGLYLSPILKGPELIIPIGHIPFHSKVTERTEHLPIAVGLLTAPGKDLELFDWAHACLTKSKRPTKVRTGPRMFDDKYGWNPGMNEELPALYADNNEDEGFTFVEGALDTMGKRLGEEVVFRS